MRQAFDIDSLLAVSGLFTLGTVLLFAYRNRAQQLRHRSEEEAARHFAEFQVSFLSFN